ncbi:MAG: hypothetical protein M0Z85_10750 [Gammaproteobacteria bacterium]|nr:hypothetical protein [Gammaproteobacteria bacterium]
MANTPAVLVPSVAGNKNALNTTTTTVVKSTAGTVRMVSVTAGRQEWKFYCENGITVVPPASGVVSVSFE